MNVLRALQENIEGKHSDIYEKHISENIYKFAKFPQFYELPFDHICKIIHDAGKIPPKAGRYILQQCNAKFGAKAIELLEYMDMVDLSAKELIDIFAVLTNIPLANQLSKVCEPSDLNWEYDIDLTEEEKEFMKFASGNEPINYEKDVFRASKRGDIDSVLYTLAKTPKMLNIQKEENHYTPLNIACYYGMTNLVSVLLQRGALTELADIDERTPLINAARKGNFECVDLLIKFKADVNKKDKTGNNALFYAVATGNSIPVQNLLKAGVSPNTTNMRGEVPLMTAAKSGFDDIIQILIDYGADVNVQSNVGWTPILCAQYESTKRILRINGAHE